MDIRSDSRERAVLCQPEVGFGFTPGGGSLEMLPLNIGRARALETITGTNGLPRVPDRATTCGLAHRQPSRPDHQPGRAASLNR